MKSVITLGLVPKVSKPVNVSEMGGRWCQAMSGEPPLNSGSREGEYTPYASNSAPKNASMDFSVKIDESSVKPTGD